MRSINKVMLLGNVGDLSEVRATINGKRVARLSLATSRSWKDAAGAAHEQTEWHKLVVWGALADVVEKYVDKGDRLYVEGSIEYRQWQDKDGQTRYTTEINVRELVLLGGKRDGGRDAAPAGTQALAARAAREQPKPVASPWEASEGDAIDDDAALSALEDLDDDLPFSSTRRTF